MKNFLVVLLGPTGVGKTDLSIEAASLKSSEIISADSRQFYREMRIGTAVPSPDQLKRIRHHFIQFLSVMDYYSASLFERDVLKLLPGMFEKNRIVFMTGGSGMYIDAVCNGIDDIPDVDPAVREKYNSMYAESGIGALRIALKMLDPDHYARVDLRNHKRIIRALEICDTTGRPYSSFLRKEKETRDFSIIKIGLNRNRDELYKRIDSRVGEMMNSGLEEEAKTLFHLRHMNALNTVGYRELFDFFEGKTTLPEAVRLISRNTRRYAKRQVTWWRKDESVKWFEAEDRDGILGYIDKVTKP